MASFKVIVYQNGKPTGRESNAETFDFLSIRVGASTLEIKETGGHFDFAAKRLTNIAAGTGAGHAVEYGQLNTALADYIPLTQKAAANGVASLDAGGKVPVAQLPNSIMEYLGTWNASTNTPTLANGVGNAGDVYVVSVAGTQNLGAGNITFAAGDWIIYNGSIWEKSVNSNAVASVNGFTGVVVLTTSDIAEGTNLYYTNARFDTQFGTKTTDDLAEGATNLYYSTVLFDTDFNTKTTDDLTEGSTNLYHTTARARTAVVDDAITNGVTDKAPSQNAVFDALALKVGATATLANNTGSAIAAEKVVRITATGIALATNNASTAINLVGITTASIADTASGPVHTAAGTEVAMTGLTAGSLYYLSTSGDITTTAPTAVGSHVIIVGRALSTTSLLFNPQYVAEIAS